MSTRTATTTATTTVTTSVSTITTPGSATNVGTGLDTPTLLQDSTREGAHALVELSERRLPMNPHEIARFYELEYKKLVEEQEKQKDVWRYEQEQ